MATWHIRSKFTPSSSPSISIFATWNASEEEAEEFYAPLQKNSLTQHPSGVASRRGSATQGSVGDRVTPTWITRRVLSSMMKNAKSGRKKRSLTCKKAQAQIAAA